MLTFALLLFSFAELFLQALFLRSIIESMGPQAVIAVSLLLSVTHGGSIQFIFNGHSYIITYTTNIVTRHKRTCADALVWLALHASV